MWRISQNQSTAESEEESSIQFRDTKLKTTLANPFLLFLTLGDLWTLGVTLAKGPGGISRKMSSHLSQ